MFKTEPLFSSEATPGTGKNLNNLLADDGEEGEQEPPGLIQQILNFWSKLWSPSTSDAEKLGWSYVYAEDGSLLGEYGSGGSASSGTSQYLYLPTASGPMPIAAIIKGQTYAIHSDHLNTPRRLTQADGQAAWQWAYSAFGEEQPTTGAKRFTSETTTPSTGATSIPEVTFNLRYPGQYFDSETKLHYNHFRTYDGRTGRYTQFDPIGLDGGWNGFSYVDGNPLSSVDPMGLQAAIPTPIGPVPLPITPSPGFPSPRPIDPTEPSSPTYTPGVRMPDMSPLPLPIVTIGQIIYTWATSNCPADDSSFWKGLRPYRGKTKTNGESGKGRRFYEWDYTHGDVEVYDGRGNHLGSANPATGEPTKPPVPGRRINL